MLICFSILIFAPLMGSQPAAAGEEMPNSPITLLSKVVCAPGTHSSCKPGPFTKEVLIPGTAHVTVDIFLLHTEHYEENEQSWFFSELGDILDCGPIPPDQDELHCGQVSGRVDTKLTLTIEHSGGGDETGSHKQRYEIEILPDRIFLPFVAFGP